MDAWVWALIIVAAIVVIAAVVFGFVRRLRQRRELHDWFGPESVRTSRSGEKPSGGRRRASGTRKAS
jgi:flagellar biosynthesis/type III secretory pathway M-ring protein FliF/YscJ